MTPYQTWNRRRRELWPYAYHGGWESYFGGQTVASWDPDRDLYRPEWPLQRVRGQQQ
jgi:hypothetical protein